jgi:hypothetical protein
MTVSEHDREKDRWSSVAFIATGGGGWLVLWRTCGSPHASREDALAEAHTIAAAHGVHVVEQ